MINCSKVSLIACIPIWKSLRDEGLDWQFCRMSGSNLPTWPTTIMTYWEEYIVDTKFRLLQQWKPNLDPTCWSCLAFMKAHMVLRIIKEHSWHYIWTFSCFNYVVCSLDFEKSKKAGHENRKVICCVVLLAKVDAPNVYLGCL